jgi:hypothetical protein
MKWATKLLFVGFLLICFPCCEVSNQQQRNLRSFILVYLYVCFLLLLPLLCGMTPPTHKNIIVIHCVPHNTYSMSLSHIEMVCALPVTFLCKIYFRIWRIELKCVYKTMCDMWMRSALVTLIKKVQFVSSQRCGMSQQCEVETWNPHIFNDDTKKWHITK